MAHLHLLLASESDAALLIKYGPGRATCTVGWDRSTDEFVAGQCLDARLQGADLSPDGKDTDGPPFRGAPHIGYGHACHRARDGAP